MNDTRNDKPNSLRFILVMIITYIILSAASFTVLRGIQTSGQMAVDYFTQRHSTN